MTIAPRQLVLLLVIAILGHVMALVWYLAGAYKWSIAARTIYDMPISKEQIRREFRNSLHAPMHAVLLAPLLYFGFFANTTWLSLVLSLVVATVWAEIWHYASHRAFHLEWLHWIHREHHKSHLNSWLTAISFSFFEKLIFDAGFLGLLAALDMWVSLNFSGHSRVVHRLPHDQLFQSCEFRAEIRWLHQARREGADDHHLSRASPLEIYRQLRLGHTRSRSGLQDRVG